MAWTDEYTDRGTFRGVGFWARSAETRVGRKVARHDFPGLTVPAFEDLGLAPREFQLEALVIGADYMADRDRLLNALEQPGPGELEHPWYGPLTVTISEVARVTETTREGGMCVVAFSCTIAEELELLPVEPDTSAELIIAADGAFSALAAAFEAVFEAVEAIEDLRDSIVGTIHRATTAINKVKGAIDSALSIVTDIGDAVGDLLDSAASLILTPVQLVNTFKGAITAVMGGLNTVTNALGQVSNLFGGGGVTTGTSASTAGLVSSQATATADELAASGSSRAADGRRMDVLMQAVRELAGSNRALEIAQGQGDPPPSANVDGTYETGPYIFGDNEPDIPATTPTRLQEAANQQAVIDLVRGQATIAACQQIAVMSFETVSQATSVLEEMTAQLDYLAEQTTDDALFFAYQDLRTALVRHINQEALNLPALVEYTPHESMPAVVIAYELYGDARRDLEIVRRNRIAHPGAVTGGVSLQVVEE